MLMRQASFIANQTMRDNIIYETIQYFHLGLFIKAVVNLKKPRYQK